MTIFDVCIERVLKAEAGYVNLASDPGGETNFGISRRAYPNVDIKGLTRSGAIAIYRRDYWDKIRGDDLPPAIAFQVLDAAVNHGIDRAVSWLQIAAGADADGHLGSMTIQAIKAANPLGLALRFNAERLHFYVSLGGWMTFGRGWSRRLADNLSYAAQDNSL